MVLRAQGEQAGVRGTQDRSGSENLEGARERLWEQGPQNDLLAFQMFEGDSPAQGPCLWGLQQVPY